MIKKGGYTDEGLEKEYRRILETGFTEDGSGILRLNKSCFIFNKGTDSHVIINWFNSQYSKGFYGLVKKEGGTGLV